MNSEEKQFLIFLKYTREYLSQVTGYSKGTLSRIACGARLPSEVFIAVCCHNLPESQAELFRYCDPDKPIMAPSRPGGDPQDLLETIDELGARLTETEAKVEALKKELNQYS